jgi:hypothetical protein
VADNPFQTAAKAALPAFYTLAGELVTYKRGAAQVQLTALRNRQGADMVDSQGVYARAGRLEFTFKQADLVLGGSAAEPQRGDTITDAAGVVYDVQADVERLEDTAEWRVPVREVDA